MRYLITGGAGFIGSHLADLLLDEGEHVHVLDNLSTGNIENIRHLKEHPRFEYTIDSIEKERLLAELVDGVDVVFHLAAAVGVFLIVERPVQTIETNISGTKKVLNMAAKKRKKVLLASTSEVYGKSKSFPYSEDDDMVMGPTSHSRWSYACSKAVDEFLGLSYWKEKDVPVVIARIFNTVGPRQVGQYGMVIPRFVKQAMDGGPITVYGDGTQSRCFAHVKDVVQGLYGLVREDGAHGQVFNIGNDEEISIMSLAERVQELVNPDASIETIPYEEAYEEGFEDMPRRVPDLSRIKEMIDYEPERDLGCILEEVHSFLRNSRNG